MATFLERATHLDKRSSMSIYNFGCLVCLFIILVVSHFGFDGKIVFLIHQFLVIAYL